MFTIIKGLPDDVLGVMISGKIVKEDYDGLKPLMQKHKEKHEKIKLFVEVEEFKYTAKALWEDFKFGFIYLGTISAMTIVTNKEWLEEAIEVFGTVWPGIKTEGFDEREAAIDWINKQ